MKSYIALGFGNNFFHAFGSDAISVPVEPLQNNAGDDSESKPSGDDAESDADGRTNEETKDHKPPLSYHISLLPLHPSATAKPTTHPTNNPREWLLSIITNSTHLNPHYAASSPPTISCGATHTTLVLQDGGAHMLGTIFGKVHAKLSPQPTRLPLKIIKVASGRRHVMALTEGCSAGSAAGGVLLTWGAGHFGQLGHGPELTSSLEPRIVERLLPQSCGGRIVDISAGGLHSMAIVAIEGGASKSSSTSNGEIVVRETKTFCWGSNRKSQCGIEGGKCATVPSPVPVVVVRREGREGVDHESRVDRVVHFEKVEGGRLHSVGLTAYGEVFTWGSTSMGRCGQSAADTARGGDRRICAEPRYVSALRNVAIDSIAAGDAHTLALSRNGRVFAWGAGGDGQCGQGHIGNLFSPKGVREIYFEDEKKDCGDGVGKSTEQNESDLPRPNSRVELEVAMEEEGLSRALGTIRAEKSIVRIRAAGCYSAAVSSHGDVYSWGYGGGVAMGHPIPLDANSLPLLPLIEGNQYSYTTTAKVYPEGCDENDNVRDCHAFDTELNVLTPRKVEVVKQLGLHVEDVCLGPGHMVMIASIETEADENGLQCSNEQNQSAVEEADDNQNNNDTKNVPNGDSGQTDTSESAEDLIPPNVALNTEGGVNVSMASTTEVASNTTYESLESTCNSKPERRRDSKGGFLSKIKSSRSNRDISVPNETSSCAAKEKKKSFLPVGKLIDAAFHRNGGK